MVTFTAQLGESYSLTDMNNFLLGHGSVTGTTPFGSLTSFYLFPSDFQDFDTIQFTSSQSVVSGMVYVSGTGYTLSSSDMVVTTNSDGTYTVVIHLPSGLSYSSGDYFFISISTLSVTLSKFKVSQNGVPIIGDPILYIGTESMGNFFSGGTKIKNAYIGSSLIYTNSIDYEWLPVTKYSGGGNVRDLVLNSESSNIYGLKQIRTATFDYTNGVFYGMEWVSVTGDVTFVNPKTQTPADTVDANTKYPFVLTRNRTGGQTRWYWLREAQALASDTTGLEVSGLSYGGADGVRLKLPELKCKDIPTS